jgi:hypothetical protein
LVSTITPLWICYQSNGQGNINNTFCGFSAEECVEIVDVVMSKIAPRDQPQEKMTLHKAAEEGKAETVRSLLDQGEDVNYKNADRKSVLDLAMFKGHLDVVHLLIERALTDMGNPQSPCKVALENGYRKTGRLQISSGDMNMGIYHLTM